VKKERGVELNYPSSLQKGERRKSYVEGRAKGKSFHTILRGRGRKKYDSLLERDLQ